MFCCNYPRTYQKTPLKSFDERQRLYDIKREEIFGEKFPTSNCTKYSETKPVTFKIYGVRQRFKLRKHFLRNISSTKLDKSSDTRKFATVTILNETINGLLDSGANITCLGEGGLDFIKRSGHSIIPFHASVNTANGASVPIIGRIKCPVKFQDVTRTLMVFVAPKLKQKMYLGSDFFDQFKLWPACVSELTSDIKKENSHILSSENQLIFKYIIRKIPSFELRALGH